MTAPVFSRPARRPSASSLDRPIATAALPPDPAHVDTIEQSHQRCASIGLSRLQPPDYSPQGRADLAITRERNRRLTSHAAPVMELLYEQIINTQSMVVLTDACGTIIHSIGDEDFLAKASKVALTPGVDWSESAKGTNAIGTALIAEQPTLVFADEHFMHANHFLTCSAAPIMDPRGNVLGVIDVTGDHRRHHQHTMGLVKMSACMIENHWLTDDFRDLMRLHLHVRPEFLGTLMEGILAVNGEGRIVGANRSALDLIGLSSAGARMQTVTSLFGVSVGALVDHFRAPLAAPLPLRLPTGVLLHLRAHVNWAMGVGVPAPAAGAEAPLPAADAGLEPRAQGPAEQFAPSAEAGPSLQALDTGDAQLRALIGKVRKVIDRDIPILVLGETGTGKELLARAIHHDSARSRMPFVAVNCASIPETLIEAELFGYEDGAFTGARRKGAVGKIVQAHGGTLFLDEIGDMPPALQARLLRVLQERQVVPLGGHKPVAVDVAIISATHRDLRAMMEAKAFRDDLYYRLNGLALRMPPLRERSDLAALVRLALDAGPGRPSPQPDAQVMQRLAAYRWPGNVRQLRNVLRTAALMASGEDRITLAHLSDDFLEESSPAPATTGPAAPPMPGALPVPTGRLQDAELEMIRQAVEAAGGNISAASKRLGIARNTIYRRLRWNVGH